MREHGCILYLNGSSSAGKGTLARSLQTAWGGPLFHISIDMLFGAVQASGYNSYGPRDAQPAHARDGVSWIVDDDGAILSIEFGEHGRKLMRGLHAMVVALAREGNDVVVDSVIFEPWVGLHAAQTFAGERAFLVGLLCDAAELERREGARGNRLHGLARLLSTTPHEHVPVYDLELDSTNAPPEELASAVVAHVSREPPRAFARWAAEAEVSHA
jgi:chloramphenicol 3-O phosphotransferase